jgi:hypothetical protein
MSGGLGDLEILEKFAVALDHSFEGEFGGGVVPGGEGRFFLWKRG